MFSKYQHQLAFDRQLKLYLGPQRLTNKVLIGFVFLLYTAGVMGGSTSDNVFHEALILERQIDLLRSATKNTLEIKKPNPQKDKSPVHTYAKSLEVREKIIALQKLYKLKTINLINIPATEITPTNVLSSVTSLTQAMSTVLQAHQLDDPSGRSIVSGITSNEVYEKLWLISNSLDTFIGPIKPSSVYVKVSHALAQIKHIAEKYDVKYQDHINTRKNATPKDVNIEGYRNLYRIEKLQLEMGISTNPVGDFPIGSIKPADVYDTTNIILAELSKIRVKLNIPSMDIEAVNGHAKTPSDVLNQMKKIGQISDLLIKQIKGS